MGLIPGNVRAACGSTALTADDAKESAAGACGTAEFGGGAWRVKVSVKDRQVVQSGMTKQGLGSNWCWSLVGKQVLFATLLHLAAHCPAPLHPTPGVVGGHTLSVLNLWLVDVGPSLLDASPAALHKPHGQAAAAA